jgi:PEGA domain/Protein kinase domain
LATGISGVSAFLAQDYVAADSLDSVVREYGPAPVGNALRVATQLAGALDFAAAVYVTHGALHPRDVLLSSDETRLTGLGVARALERIGVTAPVRRPYTAPERIAGGEWDRRADVFSLAALTHELLWGRRVSGVGAQAAESLSAIDGVDLDALRAVFARALAELPADRYGSALEFVEALRLACPDVAVVDAPASPRRPAAPEVEPPVASEVELRLPLDSPSLDEQVDELRRDDVAVEPPVVRRPSSVVSREAPVVPPPAMVEAPLAVADVPPAIASTPTPQRRRAKADRPAAAVAPVAPALVEPPSTPLPASIAQNLSPADLDIATTHVGEPDITYEPVPDLRRELGSRDEPTTVSAGLLTGHDSDALSAFEVTRTAVWPLVLALGVGIAIGFAGGYFSGTREQPPPPAAVAASPAPVAAAKEFTESAVAPPSMGKSEVRSQKSEVEVPKEDDRKPSLPLPLKSETSNLKSPAPEGRLLVRTRPAGARVSVDGKDYGKTPATIHDLARGAHRVKISHEGYVTDERRIVVTAAKPGPAITVALVPTRAAASAPAARGTQAAAPTAAFVGSLSVDSRPAGATVFMDGKLIGTTPVSLKSVPAGEHAIRLEHDGYRRWSSSVRVVASEQNRVTASLER